MKIVQKSKFQRGQQMLSIQNCDIFPVCCGNCFNTLKYVYHEVCTRYEAIQNMFITVKRMTRGKIINMLFYLKINDFWIQIFVLYYLMTQCIIYYKGKKCYIYIYTCLSYVCINGILLIRIMLVNVSRDLQRSRVIKYNK